jgi:cytokinin riboside 5'-monophosphate phosphoribohydrolase
MSQMLGNSFGRMNAKGCGITVLLIVSIHVHSWFQHAMAKLLCVYCASSDRIDPKYFAAAAELGRAMVMRGWGLVYGGGRTGAMGAVARAVKQYGGRVIGVIPEFMKLRELAYDEVDELVTVITMRERKLLMESRADAFVALPGGWGTLEEILEILTLRQLDVVKKPCVFLNQDGFYDPLLKLFEGMLAGQFFRPSNMDLFRVARTPAEVFDQIEAAEGSPAPGQLKWFE